MNRPGKGVIVKSVENDNIVIMDYKKIQFTFFTFYRPVLFVNEKSNQGRTDPMGVRALPWGPSPKGAHQTSKNNANEIKSLTKSQLLFDNRKKTSQSRLWAPLARIYHLFLHILSADERFPKIFSPGIEIIQFLWGP